MVNITINLTPALTGVNGKIWIKFGDYWNPLLDIPPSSNGLISFGYSDTFPNNEHKIVLPEQTVEGTTYLATETPAFTLTTDKTFNITLTPKEVPPPPPTPPAEIKIPYIALPSIIAGAILVYLGGR